MILGLLWESEYCILPRAEAGKTASTALEEQQRRFDIRLNDLSAGLKSIEKASGQRNDRSL